DGGGPRAEFARRVDGGLVCVDRAVALDGVRRGEPIAGRTREAIRAVRHRAGAVQAGDLHVASGGLRGQAAQAIGGEVGVGLEPPEAEAAMLVEQSFRAGAWPIPGRRQPNRFNHGSDSSSFDAWRLAGRMASTAIAETTVSAHNTGS